ncbi:mucin-5AC-like [Penaeus japonicus]|uniref:mucin-5AC-like n=1 Tax=Penaeus japonicus TaxID=27405 RepID=UPI001C70B4B9|nr:mucin-5AC-like [Penaeus japonicus]
MRVKKTRSETLYRAFAMLTRVQVMLATLPGMATSAETRTSTGTMWYQAAVSDISLEGSPSISYDQPMTSLMCASHAARENWSLYCHADQLCILYDVEVAGNPGDSSTAGLNICMSRIPPETVPTHTDSTTTIPSITDSASTTSPSTNDPVPPTTPTTNEDLASATTPTTNEDLASATTTPSNNDHTSTPTLSTNLASPTTSSPGSSPGSTVSTSTSVPTTTPIPKPLTKASLFLSEATINDLSRVNQSQVCGAEDGIVPPYLYKDQIDFLLNTHVSAAGWTSLVGEKSSETDWTLTWPDGSTFSAEVTGYGVSKGSTGFGNETETSQRLCFALEGPEFVAHPCDELILMRVICLVRPTVFLSLGATANATYESQDAVCRSEGGQVLPRLTRPVLDDIIYYYRKITAWTTVTGKVCQETDWSLLWPDDTRIVNATLDLPWSSGHTAFANTSSPVDESQAVCFVVEDSKVLVAHSCTTSGSRNVLCSPVLSPFVSMAKTINGSFGNQGALCASEGGQVATRIYEDNLLDLNYYYGSFKAWTTIIYEVRHYWYGWRRYIKWHDREDANTGFRLKPTEKYTVEMDYCFVFRGSPIPVTQQCFETTTLMSVICVAV